MSKTINNNIKNYEPKTIMQKLIDKKKEDFLSKIVDISGNTSSSIDASNNYIDLSNNPIISLDLETPNVLSIQEQEKYNELIRKKMDLLEKIRKNCIQLNLYHNSRYHYYRILLFTVFRIPLILLSGLNSFFAVGMQKYLSQSDISLINALLSLFCGVLTGIEILLNLQKRMETELDSYKKYYKLGVEIYKEIQVYQKDKDVTMESLDKILNRIYDEYQSNVLTGNAITIYNRVYTDEFEDLEENTQINYINTNNLITNLYYAINHPCSICGASISRNIYLSLRHCFCCANSKQMGNPQLSNVNPHVV